MARKLARLTLDNLGDLPEAVQDCVYWELDPVARTRAEQAGEARSEKEAWLSRILLEWGSCGRVAYVDGKAVGFVLYAPPVFFPGSAQLPTAPVGEDAVQLATAYVDPAYGDAGVGRMLLQAMVKDLLKRGDIRAVEAFGAQRPDGCVLPVEFLARCGFKTQRAHPRNPRMRMELKSVLTWKEDVEAAIERLVGVVRPVKVRPASQNQRGSLPPSAVPPQAGGQGAV